MPSNVNVNYSNYSAGTGIGTASTDASATWLDNAGNPQNTSRVALTLNAVLTSINGKTTAAQQRAIFYHLLHELLMMDAGLSDFS